MGSAALTAAGFEPMRPMEVIRAKCLDCCGSAAQEVRLCVAVGMEPLDGGEIWYARLPRDLRTQAHC
jgi:hypothetical protein